LAAACAVYASDAPDRDKNDFYIIENAERLKWFRGAVNKGAAELNAVLKVDTSLGRQGWVPIGRYMENACNGTL